jgi:hypothetical protein
MTVKKPICGYCKAHQRNPTTIRDQYANIAKHIRKIQQLLQDLYVSITNIKWPHAY